MILAIQGVPAVAHIIQEVEVLVAATATAAGAEGSFFFFLQKIWCKLSVYHVFICSALVDQQ